MKTQWIYAPLGAAADLFDCDEPEVLIEGPAGTGKTRAVLEKLNYLALRWPGMRGLMVRKTRRSMTESVLATFEQHVIPSDWDCLAGPRRSLRESYVYANGSRLVIGGMDRSSKVMSSEYDVIAVFEASEISENDWESLLTRLRNARMPFHQAIADTNPDTPSHWINRRAQRGDMVRLLSRHTDNPSLTTEYLNRLDHLTGIRRKRLRDGIWAVSEGLVYDCWNPHVHLIDPFPIPASWKRIRSIDFGYTNPFVCQWWAVDDDDRMYLYREMYKTRELVQEHAHEIGRQSSHETIACTIADHDAEGRATLQHYGIDTIAAQKAVSIGIQRVTDRLRMADDARPRLLFMRDALIQRDERLTASAAPCCTADEFEGYVWQQGASQGEQPTKTNDHGMDAMRYAVAYVDHATHNDLDVRVIGTTPSQYMYAVA